MDFIVFFSLIGSYMLSLVFSYDIVCQWSRNLLKRMKQYPSFMQIDPKRILGAKFVLPKFHIFNHGLSCQLRYSLNYLKYSARMNGEDPERWWVHINPISMSTREMGSGSRTDTIDDHARAWNWRKITTLGAVGLIKANRILTILTGASLRTQLAKAIVMEKKHREALEKFTATFPSDVVAKWDKMVDDWDADMSKPNPYEEPVPGKYRLRSC